MIVITVGMVIGWSFIFFFGDQDNDTSDMDENSNSDLEEVFSEFPFSSEEGGIPDVDTVSDSLMIAISGKSYFVGPDGNDKNSGTEKSAPFATIQKAIDLAQPGDGVVLLEGEYRQRFFSRRDGTESAPIVIRGSRKSVVKGDKEYDRVIEIRHDHIVLEGFSVDGLTGSSDVEKNYRDKLIYVQGGDERSGVTGLKMRKMLIENAGGECIRLLYFAEKNEISYNTIRGCGAFDYIFDGGGKNGEGIYVGTAPEQRDEKKSPTSDPDISRDNWIHHNYIDTQGNECVDIKEDSIENIVEYNHCTGQKDSESAGLDARGDHNIFRFNKVHGNKGAGIRFGGDDDGHGVNNSAYNNNIHNNANGGIKIMRKPQGKICENIFSENKKGNLVGEYSEDFENAKSCSDEK